MNWSLLTFILIPFITSFIGWLTNWFAIKMLFHPRKPRSFLLFGKWQGLVPKRQDQLAGQAAEIIEREIISHHVISHEIRKMDLRPHLKESATRLVRDRLAPKLKQMPLLGGFINEGAVQRMEKAAQEEIIREADQVIDILALDFESRFDIKSVIEERIRAFEVDKLESIVNEVARREFKTIEHLGAILGFVIGLGQLALLFLTGAIQIG